jgi:hypothetical protein
LNSDEMLKTMVAEAVKQQTQIRSAVCDITLKALQARELGLGQINSVVSNVTKGLGSSRERRRPVPASRNNGRPFSTKFRPAEPTQGSGCCRRSPLMHNKPRTP